MSSIRFLFPVLCCAALLALPQPAGANYYDDWLTSDAPAQSMDYPAYLGLGYSHLAATYEDALPSGQPENFPGGEIFLGYRVHPNFNIEIGGFMTTEEKDDAESYSSEFRGGYASIALVIPLFSRFHLLADIGYMIVSTNLSPNVPGVPSIEDGTKTGWRAGGGLEWFLTEHYGLRAMAHMLEAPSPGMDRLMQYDGALVYHF
jgi:opacity protein-like surface antigen